MDYHSVSESTHAGESEFEQSEHMDDARPFGEEGSTLGLSALATSERGGAGTRPKWLSGVLAHIRHKLKYGDESVWGLWVERKGQHSIAQFNFAELTKPQLCDVLRAANQVCVGTSPFRTGRYLS